MAPDSPCWNVVSKEETGLWNFTEETYVYGKESESLHKFLFGAQHVCHYHNHIKFENTLIFIFANTGRVKTL